MTDVDRAAATARATSSTSTAVTSKVCTVREVVPPTQDDILATALDYAARGFAVFPCLDRSKAPACSRGFHDATTNPATLRRWFGSYYGYNCDIPGFYNIYNI